MIPHKRLRDSLPGRPREMGEQKLPSLNQATWDTFVSVSPDFKAQNRGTGNQTSLSSGDQGQAPLSVSLEGFWVKGSNLPPHLRLDPS
jgi:hypothetical protein